jgi:hypothetical protein
VNYTKILKKNPSLFPFINSSLALDLMNMKTEKAIKLKFSKLYQLEYVGEVAERWDEREVVKNREDFIGLSLGLAKAFSNDFLYNQKEIFINKAAAWLKKNFDLTSALAVLYFANEQGLDMRKIDSLKSICQRILDCEKKIQNQNELVFAIHLAVTNKSYVHVQKDGADDQQWRKMICSLLDQLDLHLESPHEDYFLLALLSSVYNALEKPKAKEFKTKGMVRYLQSIAALSNKEIDEERSLSISEVLRIKKEDVFAYNYLLVFECGYPQDQDITEPGYVRICERYVESQFLSKNRLPKAFLERLEEDQTQNRDSRNFTLSFLVKKMDQFTNMDNLRMFLKYANDILFERLYPSHIFLIQHDLVDEDKKFDLVARLLRGENFAHENLNREQFDYLQKQLRAYQTSSSVFEFKPNQHYVDLCIKYGHLLLDDIEKLESLGVISYVVEHILRNQSLQELMGFLEKIDIQYRDVLLKHKSRFIKELEGEELKRFYQLYLKQLFYKEPSKYAKTIYELLKDDSFETLFELSEKDVEEIEKTIYDHQLLSKYDAEELYRKYTPAEVLEQERIEKAKEKINQYSDVWSMKYHFKQHLEDMKSTEMIRKAFVEHFKAFSISGSNLDDFLILFYQLKYHQLLTDEEIQELEEKAIRAVGYAA